MTHTFQDLTVLTKDSGIEPVRVINDGVIAADRGSNGIAKKNVGFVSHWFH